MRNLLLVLSLLCVAPVSSALAQFDELAAKARPGANAVMAMDVAALKSTPLAERHGWVKKLESAFIDRTIFLPPGADKVLVASQLQLADDFQPDWQSVVMKMSQPVSMVAIARAEGVHVDDIGGTQTVLTKTGAYLFPLGSQLLGVLSPGNRQAAASWIRDAADQRGNPLPAYLGGAINRVNGKTQIVLAIDLKNVTSARAIAERLRNSKVIADAVLNPDAVAAMLQTIQGVSIDMSIDTQALVKSRIEFGNAITLSDSVAKGLVLETLADLGLDMPELAGHKFQVAGQSIFAEGSLSANGMRRLLSILEVPTTNDSEPSEASGSTSKDMAASSQKYYKSVVTLLDDLHGDREKLDTRGGTDGVWMDRYAKKIDRLPILNVDPDLLDWGSKTAETLRIMSSSRKNAGLSAGSQKSALRTGLYYDNSYGSYGGIQGNTAQNDAMNRYQIDRQLGNSATSVRVEGWRLIDDAAAAVRKTMTTRYSLEF
ncbi:hypothetical protein [Planctomicrobium piriforme]|uniref:Uncharacterized protein n=1 Tax=Planctomicrobium piriforme TaxID=1576369 RepID=A0A1I3SJ68_9PLAN|nr:hypothetical protein [Planctomicrobium piriforme]SFJ57517.1 hypothetical protein SAMN05421753_12416 [Planctomicrobium piriforme]